MGITNHIKFLVAARMLYIWRHATLEWHFCRGMLLHEQPAQAPLRADPLSHAMMHLPPRVALLLWASVLTIILSSIIA